MKQLLGNPILIGILVLASILRLVWLNNVPNSITYDQLYYVLNAQSFLKTGMDISGTITPLHPLLFLYAKGTLVQAELPFFLLFPVLSIREFSLFNVVLPNAILSILTVGILYLIGTRLFNKKTGLIISFIATINPWFIFSGRTFYEVVPTTLFYMAGFYVLLIAKGWKILWAFPLFLLAFYSYIGTKLIFFPFVLITVFYSYFVIHKKAYKRPYIVLLSLCLMVVIFFAFQLKQQPELSRLSEILLPNHTYITSEVNQIHKVSLRTPVTFLFENKITVYIRIIINNLFNVFNLNYLLMNGDTFFSMYRHGLFYIIDGLFLGIGVCILLIRKRSLFIFLFSLIILSVIPQIIHVSEKGGNFTPHITLLFPLFIIIIGLGITETIDLIKKKYTGMLFGSIILFYFLSLANFLNIYFSQFPIQTNIFDFSSRLLAKYIALNQENNKNVVIYSVQPEDNFTKYLFYSNVYAGNNVADINAVLQNKSLVHDGVQFLHCADHNPIASGSAITILDTLCKRDEKMSSIKLAQVKDSGSSYFVYNDDICRDFVLPLYISGLTIGDLDVEKLSSQKLCETYFIK